MTRVVQYYGPGCSGHSIDASRPCRVGDSIRFSTGLQQPSWCEGLKYWTVDGQVVPGTGLAIDATFAEAGQHFVGATVFSARTGGDFGIGLIFRTVNSFEVAGPFEAQESSGFANIVIERSHTAGTASVDFATSDGTAHAGVNYQAVSGTLQFAENEWQKTVAVPLIDDAEFRPGVFNLTLSNASSGYEYRSRQTGAITIVDDDPVPALAFEFDAPEYVLREADGTIVPITVRLTSVPLPAAAVTVRFNLSSDLDGQIAFSSEPWPLQLTFAPGETAKTLTAKIRKNLCYLNAESTVTLRISSVAPWALANDATTKLRVIEAQPIPILTLDDVSIQEGYTGTQQPVRNLRLSGTLCRGLRFATVVTPGTASAASDYVNGDWYFVDASSTTGSSTIAILGDALFEADETFNVSISNPVVPEGQGLPQFARTIANVTIVNDDPPPGTTTFFAEDPLIAEAGSVRKFHVWFNTPVAGVDVSDFALRQVNVINSAVVSVVPTETQPDLPGYFRYWDAVVRVGNATGPGASVALQLLDDDSIVDQLGTPMGGSGHGNGAALSTEYEVPFVAPVPLTPELLIALVLTLAIVAVRRA